MTLHSYRSRWDVEPPDPTSVWLEDRIRATKALAAPTLYIQGGSDDVNPPAVSEDLAKKFEGPFERLVLSGIGHFPMREAPREVGERLARHFAYRPR